MSRFHQTDDMYTIGIDLIEVQRIEHAVACWGERFLRRVYTPAEIEYCAGRAGSLAARWAAKEAASKALGTGWAPQAPGSSACRTRGSTPSPWCSGGGHDRHARRRLHPQHRLLRRSAHGAMEAGAADAVGGGDGAVLTRRRAINEWARIHEQPARATGFSRCGAIGCVGCQQKASR